MIIANYKILLFLISISNSIIVIPFTTYVKEEPKIMTSKDIINQWEENIIYSETFIGTPPQKIKSVLNSQSYGMNLFQHMCDLSDSLYNRNISSSFYLEKIINSYSIMNNASIINETLYFYDNFKLKERKPFKFMKLIYSDNDENIQKEKYQYHENTCINIGLQLSWMNYYDYPVNLVNQLKKDYNIIETYIFSFKYQSENDGILVIGSEPHIYDPKNYNYLQYRMDGALGNTNSRDWFITFDKIYHTYKIKNSEKILNETIGLIKSLKIQFENGLILGNDDYLNIIKRHFFNDLIKNGKCFEENLDDKKTIFYCDKSAQNDIKNDFPTLYFESKQFNEVFELTYEDLFREKNGKIYFLVYFSEYFFGDYITVGKIFLKKYFFTFNQDAKTIGYYNNKLPKGKDNSLNPNSNENNIFNLSNKYLVILIIILIIIFAILGFYLGKFIYAKVRKKRINEVDDNFDYNTIDNKENSINENEN